jgi:4'-phosphopantetheinyl transferase
VQLNWPVPSEFSSLSADEVHLWAVALDAAQFPATNFAEVLSPDEHARARAFVTDKPRQAFAISRAALRNILGRYLNAAPRDLAIATHRSGKPQLASGDLRFNLAHSGSLALIAVTRGCEIGVDVEWLRPIEHARQIAARSFHANEQAAIHAAADVELPDVFLRCWTRKEAVLKAIGVGLGYPLDAFDTLTRTSPVCLTIPATVSLPAARCWLSDVDPSCDYLAAVATLAAKRPPMGFTYSL